MMPFLKLFPKYKYSGPTKSATSEIAKKISFPTKLLGHQSSSSFQPYRSVSIRALWHFFHNGNKQNAVHFTTYCKACIDHHTKDLMKKAVIWEMDNVSQME